MGVNFDQAIDRRNTNCSKYDGMEASFGRNDLLPLWIGVFTATGVIAVIAYKKLGKKRMD